MSPDTEAYRVELRPRFPRWYRGWEHFAVTNAFLGGLAAWLASRAHGIRPLEWLGIPLGLLASNLVEYVAHRGPLHKPWGILRYIYRAHGIQHHRFFTGDTPERMTTTEPHDFAVVLFGPQSQAGLLLGVGLPLAMLVWLAAGRNTAMLFGATATAYFLLYEWMHLLYHLPATNPLTRLPGIPRMQRHHARHHEPRLMSKWNFNITFPLFDAVFRTTFHEEPAAVRPPVPAPQAQPR